MYDTTAQWYYDTICPSCNQLFAIRSDLSRQHIMTHRRIGATGMSLCINVRFVLLVTTVFHYDTICPIRNHLFVIRSDLSR